LIRLVIAVLFPHGHSFAVLHGWPTGRVQFHCPRGQWRLSKAGLTQLAMLCTCHGSSYAFCSVSTKLLLFGIRLVVCQILETRSIPDFGDLFLILGYICGPHWLDIPNANIHSLKYYRIWIFWVSRWCSPGLDFGALQILDLCGRDAQQCNFIPPTLGHRASPPFLLLSLFSIAKF
jgi:hypothetical protein